MTRPACIQRRLYWALVLPALLTVLVFYIYPLSRVLWISLSEPAVGFGNYALLFTSPAVQRILITTARICAITSLLTLLLGYVVAYAMVHVNEGHRQWMLFCVLLTFWLSVLVRAFAWVMILRPEGPINTVLLKLGVIGQPLALVRENVDPTIAAVAAVLMLATLGGLLLERVLRRRAARGGRLATLVARDTRGEAAAAD